MDKSAALRQTKIAVKPPTNIASLRADDPRLAAKSVPALLAEVKPLFNSTLRLQAISLSGRQLPLLTKNEALTPFLFSAAGVRHVQPDQNGAPDRKIALLNVETGKPLPSEVQSALDNHPTELSLVPEFNVTLGWDNLTSDQVLESLLPSNIVQEEGVPTGFTIVGHIAHLNLLDVYLPFRFLVGHVILSKNASALRTVVNKLDTIDTEFRYFKMELLAGEPDFIAHVSESDCTFSFDFRTVYWNSRLHGEHMRLIRQFRPNQVVADVMAGVGPFALPAAKRGSWVLANDLNPSSHESLVGNAKSNKVFLPTSEPTTKEGKRAYDKLNNLFDGGVTPYCIDGREFVRKSMFDTWTRSFRGRPDLVLSSTVKDGSSADIVDEQIRTYGRNAVKQQQKRNRDKSAFKRATVSKDLPDSMALMSVAEDWKTVPRLHPRKLVDHFVMNLPASALEFLDAYRGAYTHLAASLGPRGRELVEAEIARRAADSDDDSQEVYPMVHVHCFSKEPFRPMQDILARANAALGISDDEDWLLRGKPIQPPSQTLALTRKSDKQANSNSNIPGYLVSHRDYAQFSSVSSVPELMQKLETEWEQSGARHTPDLSLHYVRDVAPNKQMYCLSFRVPPQVLWATTTTS